MNRLVENPAQVKYVFDQDDLPMVAEDVDIGNFGDE